MGKTLQFLSAIYGDATEGYASVNWFHNGYPKTRWFGISELGDMAEWAERVGQKYETYFSVNVRKRKLDGAKRGGANDIYAVGCLYADLDIKSGAHAEENLPESEDQLMEFVRELALAPSIIVSSGNGLHLYWLLDHSLIIDEENPYTSIEALSKGWERYIQSQAYTKHGWKFDTVSDLPRMLRVPGTLNHKLDPYTECKVTDFNEKRYSPSDFVSCAGDADFSYTIDGEAETDNGVDDDFSLLGTGKSEALLTNCEFLQHCRDDAASLPEPQWYAAISNLALTFDGREAVHKISEAYPHYSYAETDAKYRHAAKENKPVTCEYIHKQFNFSCKKEATCKEHNIKCPIGWVHEEQKNVFENKKNKWQLPIPFHTPTDTTFPVEALPAPYADFAKAVAESTQTPVDMAAVSILTVMAACLEHKYVVQVKPDWKEPLNLYSVVIAPPSERKSSVLRHVVRPLDLYEMQYNENHASEFEYSRARKRILERQMKFTEDNITKGKATMEDLQKVSSELATYEEMKPMQLYVDDVTPEKLASVLSNNKGHTALISSEGGIFDTLAGIYTKNVNIDVFLKAYSGDTIRVDRIGRGSEVIMNPALTILLMAQPKVISEVLSNKVFKGRGLTARFLYSAPRSFVGSRDINSAPIKPELEGEYQRGITDLLSDECGADPDVIKLSPEAFSAFTDFAEEIEGRLKTELIDIDHWAGKVAGNTARIAGILCRAGTVMDRGLFAENKLVVDEATMKNAISIGRYFLAQAVSCFDVLPEDSMTQNAEKVLSAIVEDKLTSFDRRQIMRRCRNFQTVDAIQPVLDFMEDYGYIVQKTDIPIFGKTGRPSLPKYAVNPYVFVHSEEYKKAR